MITIRWMRKSQRIREKGTFMYGTAAAITIGLFFIMILMLCAWILAIEKLINAARMKGHCKEGSGALWFIGLFASPLVLGLYTASLPDRGQAAIADKVSAQSPIDDLPAI